MVFASSIGSIGLPFSNVKSGAAISTIFFGYIRPLRPGHRRRRGEHVHVQHDGHRGLQQGELILIYNNVHVQHDRSLNSTIF